MHYLGTVSQMNPSSTVSFGAGSFITRQNKARVIFEAQVFSSGMLHIFNRTEIPTAPSSHVGVNSHDYTRTVFYRILKILTYFQDRENNLDSMTLTKPVVPSNSGARQSIDRMLITGSIQASQLRGTGRQKCSEILVIRERFLSMGKIK